MIEVICAYKHQNARVFVYVCFVNEFVCALRAYTGRVCVCVCGVCDVCAASVCEGAERASVSVLLNYNGAPTIVSYHNFKLHLRAVLLVG